MVSRIVGQQKIDLSLLPLSIRRQLIIGNVVRERAGSIKTRLKCFTFSKNKIFFSLHRRKFSKRIIFSFRLLERCLDFFGPISHVSECQFNALSFIPYLLCVFFLLVFGNLFFFFLGLD